jgi:hypothetical protein
MTTFRALIPAAPGRDQARCWIPLSQRASWPPAAKNCGFSKSGLPYASGAPSDTRRGAATGPAHAPSAVVAISVPVNRARD